MKVTEGLAEPRAEAAPERIYAIGDVHGEAGRLQAIHAAIRGDLVENPVASAIIVHLGDYIDRGPDSARCLAILSAGSPVPGVLSVCLMGNHERMLLDCLEDERKSELWLQNGGAATLQSWAIEIDAPVADWPARIPAPQLEFIRNLALSHEAGRYWFAHAGVRPGVRSAMQSPHDLLWIRREFLQWDGPMLPDRPNAVIVHGHTPTSAPEIRPNRIGIDTGACLGGKLTCAALSKDSVYFLQA